MWTAIRKIKSPVSRFRRPSENHGETYHEVGRSLLRDFSPTLNATIEIANIYTVRIRGPRQHPDGVDWGTSRTEETRRSIAADQISRSNVFRYCTAAGSTTDRKTEGTTAMGHLQYDWRFRQGLPGKRFGAVWRQFSTVYA
jgi:hypothetical protein